ncbi:alkane 1-monooxygenase [Sinomonas atrocyanea]|uniref:LLM class flavin-dependent oxidoreductase n=1 Tax=Sinomonas atrocyanea TaxID=37927 RepID=UPI00082EB269|nr:LLM class flavin-dependent oxidoreductase [Sinomonas atrocyanea]GEB64697.1 alkane 1-monooxygenase [Sinomonas atrocyanea]GGG79393.1 alkane 1-monooxygenase [Sinomonas atrocyanea]
MTALSILDLAPVVEGSDVAGALAAATRLARLAEETGYRRLWYAEHHNTDALASSATALLIANAAANTSTLRVGSGGIMLPNHAPLAVAEAFGTLANLYGDRIDLGLGRAPGTDPRTAALLRRGARDDGEGAFAANIRLLAWFFGEQEDDAVSVQLSQGVHAAVARGTHVPLWVLGSSTAGAAIAGQLGLPFAAASHFAPFQLSEAVWTYRQMFNPSAPTAQISEPYVMAGANLMVAPTREEAEFLFTTHQQMFVAIRRGTRGPLRPPVREMDWAPHEEQMATSALRFSAVGTPGEAAEFLRVFAASYGIDEIILTGYAHDPAMRERSYRLMAEEWAKDASAPAA